MIVTHLNLYIYEMKKKPCCILNVLTYECD